MLYAMESSSHNESQLTTNHSTHTLALLTVSTVKRSNVMEPVDNQRKIKEDIHI